MISSKYINIITMVIVPIFVGLCLLAMLFSVRLSEVFVGTDYDMEYTYKLFDTSNIISIDIFMDEAQWNEMLENATREEYYQCDVTINGTIPSTHSEQQANLDTLIDSSSIDMSVMGEFMGGEGGNRGERDIQSEVERQQMKEIAVEAMGKPEAEQTAVSVNYTPIIVCVGILLVTMILLCFIKRRY